jgi:hypothetical protein
VVFVVQECPDVTDERCSMSDGAQTAYCGLFCGDCVIRRGKMAALSAELLREMENPEVQKLLKGLPKSMPDCFRAFDRIEDARGVLEAMLQLDCQRACKQGGGTTGCAIRECCLKKGYEGCWCCQTMEGCETLAWLNPCGSAYMLNLRTIRDRGMAAFLAGEKHR